jgi:hypothetical protein
MMAIDEYHKKTPIRLREYDSRTDKDYIHITGENSGCWSYVGRIGGVSNTVQGVVKTSPALRTSPFGIRSKPPPPKHKQARLKPHNLKFTNNSLTVLSELQ